MFQTICLYNQDSKLILFFSVVSVFGHILTSHEQLTDGHIVVCRPVTLATEYVEYVRMNASKGDFVVLQHSPNFKQKYRTLPVTSVSLEFPSGITRRTLPSFFFPLLDRTLQTSFLTVRSADFCDWLEYITTGPKVIWQKAKSLWQVYQTLVCIRQVAA